MSSRPSHVSRSSGLYRQPTSPRAIALRLLESPGPQPAEAATLSLVAFVLGRRLVAEELGPGAGHAITASAGVRMRLDTICDTPSPPIVTP